MFKHGEYVGKITDQVAEHVDPGVAAVECHDVTLGHEEDKRQLSGERLQDVWCLSCRIVIIETSAMAGYWIENTCVLCPPLRHLLRSVLFS